MNKLKNYKRDIIYGFKIICAASKKFFLLKLILSIVAAFLPYAPLIFWRKLLNLLVSLGNEKTDIIIYSIMFLTGMYCFVLLLNQLITMLSSYVTFRYNDAINYYLDNVMIDKVSEMDLAFFESSDLNDKMNNSWSLINSTQNVVWMIFSMIQGFIQLIISGIMLCTLSIWVIPIVILLCIPSILGDRTINQMDYQFEKKHIKDQRKIDYFKELFFNDTLYEIKLYQLKHYFIDLYNEQWSIWSNARKRKNIHQLIVNSVTLIILTFNEVIIYIISIHKLLVGKILIGDVTYYISLLTQFREDFNQICSLVNSFQKTSQELRDVRSFIELEPVIEKGGTRIPRDNPRVEFKNVSFKYPNSDHYVLKDCNFVIEQGEVIGLVGLNGSGKSTIVKLLIRFYDPTDGEILIDGIPHVEYDIHKLRQMFSILFQDYVKYSFTARECITLSDIERQEDDEEILKTCEYSKIRSLVEGWNNGMDEKLTKRFSQEGKELSGGQWQRFSLARAFYKKASIVLLDEPSASLDPIAEHEIFTQCAHLYHGKSAVQISHRLSSIILVDKILVLEEGRIIEQGPHEELMKLKGRYAHLFNLQSSKYIQA